MWRLLKLAALTLAVGLTGLVVMVFVLAPGPRVPLAPAADVEPLLAGLDWRPDPASDDPAERGQSVFLASGCAACHTAEDGEFLAGGQGLETPFGTFFGPNITSDQEYGIGGWTEANFDRAVREGIAPNGSPYYPAFPYTSYTGMTDHDVADLWAYLQTVPAVAEPSQAHELALPYRWRLPLRAWRWLYFEQGGPEVSSDQPDAWLRGAYLVEVLGHCGQCHTPRTFLGGLDHDLAFAGTADGPNGRPVPDITPDGIDDWGVSDIVFFLNIGMLPDGDFAGGDMAEVISESTSELTESDRQAIAIYLMTLPGIAAQ
jgi:mono/diheme cytochrome c family protein